MLTFTNSSLLLSAEYDAATLELVIKFKNGRRYRYYGVGQWVYDDLRLWQETGRSVGEYFTKAVKGCYKFNEVKDNV